MALKTLVKIGQITNLSDARYSAGMGVEMLGFVAEENHPDYISPDKFKEITDWVSGVRLVAEFENAHPESILKVADQYAVDFLQIAEPLHLQMLVNSNKQIILKQEINSIADLEKIKGLIASMKDFHISLLLDGEREDLEADEIALIKEFSQQIPVLLGYGFNADTVNKVLEATAVEGIAMKGTQEEKPGFKDYDALADVLEVLEVD